MTTVDRRLETVCLVCGGGFTVPEWEERHWPHKPECPRRSDWKGPVDPEAWENTWCDCDFDVHEECCWECPESRTLAAAVFRLGKAWARLARQMRDALLLRG